MASATDYAHQFNPGFVLDSRTVALVVVDMQYASGSRDHGLGRLAQGPRPGGARRLPVRPHRADGGADHPATARFLPGPRAPPGLSHRGLGAARLLRPAAAHARLRRERRQHAGQPRARDPRRARPAPGRGRAQQDDDERVSLSGFERLVRAWGVEQLVFTGISTNSCVEGTARDAVDRGFRGLLVEDGCGAASQSLHDATCANFARLLGRVASSAQVLTELEGAR